MTAFTPNERAEFDQDEYSLRYGIAERFKANTGQPPCALAGWQVLASQRGNGPIIWLAKRGDQIMAGHVPA